MLSSALIILSQGHVSKQTHETQWLRRVLSPNHPLNEKDQSNQKVIPNSHPLKFIATFFITQNKQFISIKQREFKRKIGDLTENCKLSKDSNVILSIGNQIISPRKRFVWISRHKRQSKTSHFPGIKNPFKSRFTIPLGLIKEVD